MGKIVILEPGAWGTALGVFLNNNSHEISFWYEDFNLASKISKFRENNRLLGVKIPAKIFVTSELKKIIEKTELIIIASSIFSLRKTLTQLKKIKKLPPLLGVAKGIEKKTLKFPSQIVEEVLGKVSYAHLSGPGFAQEIIKGKQFKQVIASKNRFLIKKLKKLFKIKNLKSSFTDDLIGVQLAGALKNVLSIGVGLKIKKYKKDLIKFGLKEMIRLGEAMDAKKETFLGPAGIEDLILTSNSPFSRNVQFGKAILSKDGKMQRAIIKGKITVEGFNNTFAIYKLGKIYKLDLPIINEIYRALK